MSTETEFRRALEEGDFRRLRALHSALLPHIPEPTTDAAAEISLHMARTQADWLDLRKRAWSHRWLSERGLPSQLPDELKPKAERLYPVITEAVFVSANTNSPLLKPVAQQIQRSMCDAVEDCFANGDRDPHLVRKRMQESRETTLKQLLGA